MGALVPVSGAAHIGQRRRDRRHVGALTLPELPGFADLLDIAEAERILGIRLRRERVEIAAAGRVPDGVALGRHRLRQCLAPFAEVLCRSAAREDDGHPCD